MKVTKEKPKKYNLQGWMHGLLCHVWVGKAFVTQELLGSYVEELVLQSIEIN